MTIWHQALLAAQPLAGLGCDENLNYAFKTTTPVCRWSILNLEVTVWTLIYIK